MPRRIAVCDAETDPFRRARVPAPFIWGFYDGSQYQTFTETEKFVDFLAGEDCLVYAHNGGRFDWHFLLPYIEPYEEISLINGRIARFKIGAAECRDSYNLLPVPLAAYKKDDIDYSIFEAGERAKPANMAKIKAYLQSDCVYLWELINEFVTRYGLQITQASASMKQWGKISGQPIPRTNANFYRDWSAYYYGGRVQCFESGIIKRPFIVGDINSAYPRAMLEKHPYSENASIQPGYKAKADFYRVRAESTGAFPYRGDGGGLTFPADGELREFTVTGWEVQAAKDTGTLKRAKFIESATFINHVDFSIYVNHFYEERLRCKAANDDAGSLFAKLFMNSLYGKFAANPEHYRDYMVVPMDVICGLGMEGTEVSQWNFAGEFGPWGLADKPISGERARYYNVATGASITGYVRAMLWRAICGAEGVLYCDTDSVAATSLDVEWGTALGQWKHEGEFDKAGIGGKKLYIFQGVKTPEGRQFKRASKGVRLTDPELWKVARGGEVEYNSETPTFSAKREISFVQRLVRKTA